VIQVSCSLLLRLLRDMIVNLIGLIICYTLFERVLSDSNSTVGKLSNFENFALNDSKVENFVRTYKLADGQIITKLKYFNVSAIETKFDNLYLRQVSLTFYSK
jgi:hypothetical protein